MPFELDTSAKRIAEQLSALDWLLQGEMIRSAEIAGAGAMNRTVRVHTSTRSFILKQSQPYCVKFPEIPAPAERIEKEVAFYSIARRSERLRAHMPEVYNFDPDLSLALIEDLGEGPNLLSLYSGEQLARPDLNTICVLARELHSLPLSEDERRHLGNHAMREFNHEQIFDAPLREENGVDLEARTPGLGELAQTYKDDDDYVAAIIALGMLYTEADGPVLLHGDYSPGSFLRTQSGLAMIDPEFTFPGPPEFDLGILAAHLSLAAVNTPGGAEPGEEDGLLDRIAAGYAGRIDLGLVRGFAGTEIMRRLLGGSPLPLGADLPKTRQLLEQSRRWVLDLP